MEPVAHGRPADALPAFLQCMQAVMSARADEFGRPPLVAEAHEAPPDQLHTAPLRLEL
jgi:hypothetical protein